MLSCFICFFSSLFSIYFMSILFYLSYCYYTNKDRQKMSRLYFYPLSIFYRLTRQKNILSFFHILFFIIAFYKFNYYSQISWKFSLFPAYLFLSLFSFRPVNDKKWKSPIIAFFHLLFIGFFHFYFLFYFLLCFLTQRNFIDQMTSCRHRFVFRQ